MSIIGARYEYVNINIGGDSIVNALMGIDENIENDCWIYAMYEMNLMSTMIKCVLIIWYW